jgi:hypothetical protein
MSVAKVIETNASSPANASEDGRDWPRALWIVPVIDHLIRWARYHANVRPEHPRAAARIVHLGRRSS